MYPQKIRKCYLFGILFYLVVYSAWWVCHNSSTCIYKPKSTTFFCDCNRKIAIEIGITDTQLAAKTD